MKNPVVWAKKQYSEFRRVCESLRAEGLEKKAIWDFYYCKRKYKCTLDEYIKCKFYNYKDRYRKNFIVGNHRKSFVKINTNCFTFSKYIFWQCLPEYFKREMLLIPNCGEDGFVQFLKKHKKIILKPDMGSLGQRVRMMEYTDDAAARAAFQTIAAEEYTLCEEVIKQHPVMDALNPYSVNTIRISSLLVDGQVDILTATVRCGANANSITDNLTAGGIGAPIDVENGIVYTYGKDLHMNAYDRHPLTGVQIIGFQIPHWEQVVAQIKQAHKQVPQCTLYGWDVAITEDGMDIVEANSKPGIVNIQQLDGIPKGEKLLPLLKQDLLKDKRKAYEEDWLRRFGQEIDPELWNKQKKKYMR